MRYLSAIFCTLFLINCSTNDEPSPQNEIQKTTNKPKPTQTGSAASVENVGNPNSQGISEESNKDPKQVNSIQSSPQNENTKKKITLKEICKGIKEKKYKNIMILTGAGISVAAGIPDFRSANGFYSHVEKYQKKHKITICNDAEKFYTKDTLRNNPTHWYRVFNSCGKLFDKNPTYTHYFLSLLNKNQNLLAIITQNVDNLHEKSGIPKNKLIHYHGNFEGARCIEDNCDYTINKKEFISFCKKNRVPYCKKCRSVMKPNVVFFGESLSYINESLEIMKKCDLVIVIGTSLAVTPFSNLPNGTKKNTPRILLNMDLRGEFNEKNPKDLIILGKCDDSAKKMVKLLGWENDMKNLIRQR